MQTGIILGANLIYLKLYCRGDPHATWFRNLRVHLAPVLVAWFPARSVPAGYSRPCHIVQVSLVWTK